MCVKESANVSVGKHLSICLLMVIFGSLARAQTPTAYLQKVMAAYGPWSSLHTLGYTSERMNINPWQSYSFTSPMAAPNQLTFHIDFDKGRYYNRSVITYPGGYVFDFVSVGKDSTRWFYDKNKARNGKILVKQGKDSYVANMNAGFQSLPYYILKTLAEAGDSLQYQPAEHEITINRFLKNGSRIDYFFSPHTNLLQKIERITGGKKFQGLYENYKSYNGLQVATSVKQMNDGQLTGTESFTAFSINAETPADLFRVPGEYTLQPDVAPSPLQAKAIAKDVYLIEAVGGDRNIVFINMNDYIIVTEAPLSPDITKAVLNVIHTTIPGKPVKYVHLSHHHNDHTSGIPQMVAEGAVIICTPPLEIPIRAILNGVLGSTGDDYSKNPKQPLFEQINGVKVLEDKDHRVEFHPVQNSHADGLSFMYLPKEKIIYEGDLLTIPEDGTITPAIEVNKEFDRYLKQRKIAYTRIIGHHSYSFITPEMFNTMLSKK